jgi:hypothetical protein
MMRKGLLILLAGLAMPAVAFAQTTQVGQGRLDLTGTAPSACVISAPTSTSGANMSFALTGPQAAQINITQMVDQTTAQPVAASINLSLPIICNSAHTLTVTTANGGMSRIGGAGAGALTNGFREFVPYQVNAVWAGQSVNANSQTSSTPVNISVPDGAAGQLSLSIVIPAGGAPLVAGNYTDSLVIELQAAS